MPLEFSLPPACRRGNINLKTKPFPTFVLKGLCFLAMEQKTLPSWDHLGDSPVSFLCCLGWDLRFIGQGSTSFPWGSLFYCPGTNLPLARVKLGAMTSPGTGSPSPILLPTGEYLPPPWLLRSFSVEPPRCLFSTYQPDLKRV